MPMRYHCHLPMPRARQQIPERENHCHCLCVTQAPSLKRGQGRSVHQTALSLHQIARCLHQTASESSFVLSRHRIRIIRRSLHQKTNHSLQQAALPEGWMIRLRSRRRSTAVQEEPDDLARPTSHSPMRHSPSDCQSQLTSRQALSRLHQPYILW